MTLHSEAGRLARYGAVGIASNLTVYVIFLALLWLGMGPVPAAGLCYVIGLTLSYVLNRNWTFRSANRHRNDLPKFLIAYGVGFIATLVILRVLLIWLRPEIAQVLNVGLTAVVIYAALRIQRFGDEAAAT